MQTGILTSNKPNILEVIGRRLELRRSGSDFVGLCPFHDDRNPSFHVNEDRARYHCFGCHAGGDVIDFVMLIDGLTFSAACQVLNIKTNRRKRSKLTPRRKRAAEVAASWVRDQRAKLNLLVIDLMEDRDLADEIGDFELFEIFNREITMLQGFHGALKHPRGVAELLALRESIEQITADVEIVSEPLTAFPPPTSEYIAILNEHPLNFEGVFR